jgi:predicted phosphodiesterase
MALAVIGDVHGCITEFQELHQILKNLGLNDIWCVGDLVDRGPDSVGVVRYCMTNGIKSVMGNHDESICNHYRNFLVNGKRPFNRDKQLTLAQFENSSDGEELYKWLNALPHLQVFDSENLVLVHGGLWPGLPFHKQPHNVIRTQMVNPNFVGGTRWWGEDAKFGISKKTEEQSRAEGWERWYKLYDFEHNCIYGHSTWAQPVVHQNPGYGKTIGIDTGTSFGGTLTACIYEKGSPEYYISVKNKKVYYADTVRSFWEE